MTRRTRSILIDATLGKMFTGAADTSTATAANLIAGSTLRNTQINYGTNVTAAKVVTNAFKTLTFPSNALITSVKVSIDTKNSTAAQSIGSSIIITLRTGLTYATSTSVGTVSLAALTTSQTTIISISIAADSSLFADITQVGSTKPGRGLSYTPYYFMGY